MKRLVLAAMCLVAIWANLQAQPAANEFTSKEGRFAALMPGVVGTSVMEIHTAKGTLLTHIVSSTDKDLNEYLVSWTDYHQNSLESRATETTFDKMRDALVGFKGGKVLSESRLSNSTYPAREVTFSTSEGRRVKVRFYFAGDRSYQVMVESGKEESAPVQKFFDSFRLLPGTPL